MGCGILLRLSPLLALLFVVMAQTSEPLPPFLSCEDGVSKTFRSPIVTSPNGRLRARTRVDAVFANGNCGNTARLFVSRDRGAFREVYKEMPSVETGNANSMLPVRWSAGNRWLLVREAGYWYDSDFGGFDALLYDAQTGHVSAIDVNKAMKARLGADCELSLIRFDGFDARGRVALWFADARDLGDDEPRTHCIRGEKKFFYEPATQAVSEAD